MKILSKYLIAFTSGLLLLNSCTNKTFTSTYDYGYLYDNSQKVISPKIKIFHSSKDSSIVYFEIDSDDILYEKLYNDSNSFANILMKYSLHTDENSKYLVDSGTLSFVNYGSNSLSAHIHSQAKIKMEVGKDYWLSLKFRDDNKDLNIINNTYVDKRLNNNHQFYLLKNNGRILFNQMLLSSEGNQIEKSPLVKAEHFLMEYSSSRFKMTPPPFIESYENNITFEIDSIQEFYFQNNRFETSNLSKLNRFKPVEDSAAKFNYCYVFEKKYPYITDISEFIEPTRYISTLKEYKLLTSAVDPKKAIDAFWLKLAKNEDRAKKMISEFYKRVESANEHFTSYKEGWKTDKGIIWIVYGIPTTITKTKFKETWTYGESNNILSVKFEFYRKENNLSTNDYELIRSSEYKNNWYRAVDLWRQGKIY